MGIEDLTGAHVAATNTLFSLTSKRVAGKVQRVLVGGAMSSLRALSLLFSMLLGTLQAATIVLSGPSPVVPSPFTGGTLVNFEGFAEGTRINTQYGGVTFSQQNGSSPMIDNKDFLFAYESASGSGVLTGSPDGGAVETTQGLIASFASPKAFVGAILSDTIPLASYTVRAFRAGNVLLDTITLTPGDLPQTGNQACDGAPPFNGTGCGTFVGFTYSSPVIVSVQFGPSSADAGSDAFSIDDVRFGDVAAIPEPGTLLLLLGGVGALALRRKR